mgnify:CR=1 FL=1
MTLLSTRLVGEMQTWFSRFVDSSVVNKYEIPSPADIDLIYYIKRTSFVELLFNESYSLTEYFYKFTLDTNKYSWPYPVRTRLLVYPTSAQMYDISDSTGTNVFNLQSDDLTVLGALLQYRLDSTSVTIIDSTSNTFVSNILYATYSSLSTNLSKLIFLYLDLKIYGNYSNYDTTTLVATSTSVLENQYETYVLDQFYKYITTRGI